MSAIARIILLLGIGGAAIYLITRDAGAAGVYARRGAGTAESGMPFYINQPPVQLYISTIHVPDPGELVQLTYDVINPGTGGSTITFAIVRPSVDGGVDEPVCAVNVPCGAVVASHIHPDGGSCGDAPISKDEHLKIEVTSSTCATKPDGFLTPYIRVR